MVVSSVLFSMSAFHFSFKKVRSVEQARGKWKCFDCLWRRPHGSGRNFDRLKSFTGHVFHTEPFKAIFVWPCNYAPTVQKQLTNWNRAIWLVYRTDTNGCGLWLFKRTLWWKNFMPEKLCTNQPILRFDVILQHDWPIEQCLLHVRVFLGGKTKKPCFDFFIHWLIKQIANSFRNCLNC